MPGLISRMLIVALLGPHHFSVPDEGRVTDGVTDCNGDKEEATGKGGRMLVLCGADARNRTEDPIITSDVLCQLSYVGPEEAMGF